MKNIYKKVLNIILFIVIYIVFRYLFSIYYREGYKVNDFLSVNDIDKYYKNIYDIKSNISSYEYEFYIKWVNKLCHIDTTVYKQISPYMMSWIINKNGDINYSRFAIGTLTKNEDFMIDCKELLDKMNINTSDINVPYYYKWYGFAWDIENKLIKIYLLNKQGTKIICYEYKVERINKNISSGKIFKIKRYEVFDSVTIMHKNGTDVHQINSSSLPDHLIKKYNIGDKFKEMKNNSWDLDTYSEYEDKLTLYFE